jgi:hypothetical protein
MIRDTTEICFVLIVNNFLLKLLYDCFPFVDMSVVSYNFNIYHKLWFPLTFDFVSTIQLIFHGCVWLGNIRQPGLWEKFVGD